MSKHKNSDSGITLGKREYRLLSQAEQIEETLMPGFVRPMLIFIAVLIVAFLVWASVVHLTEVARAPGEIIPIGQTKVVQHLDGGEVSEIRIEEGQLVERGQVLLRIDGSQAMADLQQMEARRLALTLRAERLLAFAEDRVPDFSLAIEGISNSHDQNLENPEMQPSHVSPVYVKLINEQNEIHGQQVSARESSLAVVSSQTDQIRKRILQTRQALEAARRHVNLVSELLNMREKLGEQQLITRTELLETRRARVTSLSEVDRLEKEILVLNESLEETLRRHEDIANQSRRDALIERGVVRAELAEVEETLQRLRARVARLDVRASERGFVQDLRVMTTGQVIQPGAILMQIVPTDAPLEAEVRIAPKDIGHVVPGQQVRIRVSSYDYRRFGDTEGVLRRVSATNVVAPDGKPYFRAWVELTRPYVGNDPNRFRIQPGMSVEAEVVTGRKTLMAYLFTPVIDVVDRSFGER